MSLLCPHTALKFVGTISLGLLTGISYTTSTTILPSLVLLPSATHASQTLSYIQTHTTRRILTLASLSSISLLSSYALSGPRGKHPYLLWVALMSFLGGQGIELAYNGLDRFYLLGGKYTQGMAKGRTVNLKESEYVDVEATEGSMEMNGEKVEIEMNKERKTQMIRTIVAGLGALMGVIGIWGDGA